MLKIINMLGPFFEDDYRRISVREYSRLKKISPPTASTYLKEFMREGLLEAVKERNFHYYNANRENWIFRHLQKIYWQNKLEKTGLLKKIRKEFIMPSMILFGSAAKAEMTNHSDIDIALFSPTKKEITFGEYEKILGRKLQIFRFESIKDIKNKELAVNIMNGHIIEGKIR